jgi:hypothetical protein
LRAVWREMRRRCTVPTCREWKWYGAKGIKVTEEWSTFEPFYTWAMESGYGQGLSIDRINVHGGYSPDNCRWATRVEQGRNRSDNRIVSAFGESKTIGQWIEDPRCVVGLVTLTSRIYRLMEHERAITTPLMTVVRSYGA